MLAHAFQFGNFELHPARHFCSSSSFIPLGLSEYRSGIYRFLNSILPISVLAFSPNYFMSVTLYMYIPTICLHCRRACSSIAAESIPCMCCWMQKFTKFDSRYQNMLGQVEFESYFTRSLIYRERRFLQPADHCPGEDGRAFSDCATRPWAWSSPKTPSWCARRRGCREQGARSCGTRSRQGAVRAGCIGPKSIAPTRGNSELVTKLTCAFVFPGE